MGHHYTPEWLQILKSDTNEYCQGHGTTGTLIYYLCELLSTLWNTVWHYFSKAKHRHAS